MWFIVVTLYIIYTVNNYFRKNKVRYRNFRTCIKREGSIDLNLVCQVHKLLVSNDYWWQNCPIEILLTPSSVQEEHLGSSLLTTVRKSDDCTCSITDK